MNTTTQDVADRILEQDLKRSAIIMAAFAYNSAVSDEKLKRKTEEPIASLFPSFDLDVIRDERNFRNSGLNHSICGHTVAMNEIPFGFPAAMTVTHDHTSADSE